MPAQRHKAETSGSAAASHSRSLLRGGACTGSAVTDLPGVGANLDQLPVADVVDVCAIMALRHIGEAAEIAWAWLDLQC